MPWPAGMTNSGLTIAGKRQIAAEAGGRAIDGDDRGLRQIVQRGHEMMGPLLAAPAVEGDAARRHTETLLHALDVAAGAEPLAVPGDRQRIDGIVLRDLSIIEIITARMSSSIALRTSGRLRNRVATGPSTWSSVSRARGEQARSASRRPRPSLLSLPPVVIAPRMGARLRLLQSTFRFILHN
jgi:hypothetical protein